MKLLFDVHCQLQYQSNKAEFEKNHEIICVDHHPELPQGIEDQKIAEFARTNGYTVVTKDVDFVNYCKDEKIPIGVLKGNCLYLISESVTLFGKKPPNRLYTID